MAKKEFPKYPPARSIEERENQMINLAVNLAEQQLRDGTASPLIIAHYLKLGTQREINEREKQKEEIKLLRAKTDMIESTKRDEESYNRVIDALKLYQGNSGR